TRVVDGEIFLRYDLSLNASLNHQVLVTLDLTFDLNRRAEHRLVVAWGCHSLVLSLWIQTPGGSLTSMSTAPRNLAPSAITTRGALMSPTTLASEVISTLLEATVLPFMLPRIVMFSTSTCAVITAERSKIK